MHNLILLMGKMVPFYSSLIALSLAQLLKPAFYYFRHHEWQPHLIFSSGNFPSSHSAAVSALALSVGFQDHFNSGLFAVALIFAVIVVYDAANVRYYAGQNIQVTSQLIQDLKHLTSIPLNDPIYLTRLKTVLGHKWSEVFGGIFLGLLIAVLFYIWS